MSIIMDISPNYAIISKIMMHSVATLRILLVEDEESFGLSIKSFLGIYHDITWTRSLEETLAILQNKISFDAILLDKGLPDGAGVGLIKKIREVYPSVAIIIVTGDSDLGEVYKALNSGADDYIVKSSNSIQELMIRIPVAIKNMQNKKCAQDSVHNSNAKLPENISELTENNYTKFKEVSEKDFLIRALELCNGSADLVAKNLGIARATIFKKIKMLEIR